MATGEEAILSLAGFSDEDAERFDALASKSKGGSEQLAILRRYPESAARAGELSRHVAGRIIARMSSGKDSIEAECFRQRCAEMRRDLDYDDAPAVERLLIDRIVVTWLHLQNVESIRQAGDMSLAKAAYYDKAVSLAQADHVRALLALAKVRRLALPAVQVNMTTGNQLNIAG